MAWLHRFILVVVASTLILIVAGGLVTSTGSGLAVPDWPTSYGFFMFSFPLSYMVGGILYEHGHRLIASTVGMLTMVMVAWLWWAESRRWVRRLGLWALMVILVQGTLGGITVLLFLPAPVSIGHAGLAQIFFCLTVSLALFTSPRWRRRDSGAADDTVSLERDRALSWLSIATVALVYVQILVGATMRHTGAGLAIPDFPLAFGRIVPPEWSWPVAVHFAHRVGALVVAATTVAVVGHVGYHHRRRREMLHPAIGLAALVAVQVTLGALTVLSERNVLINTAHVATGALVLATTLVLALEANRHRLPGNDPAPAAVHGRSAAPAHRGAALAPSPRTLRS